MTGRSGTPALIERYLYAFDWDVEAIWALSLPIEERDVSELEWILAAPVWPGPAGPYTVTPMEVVMQPTLHASEFDRMLAADVAYPIDITFHLDRWVILDGVHRLLQLHRNGARTARVRIVPPEFLSRPSR
jgi:hypothetical protein